MRTNNSPERDSDDELSLATGGPQAVESNHAAPLIWQRLGMQLLVGSSGGLVAGLAVLLLFKGLYAASFAMASTIDGWLAFGIFAVAVVISIILSGLLGGLIGSVLSGVIVGQLWRPSRRWLASWISTWIVGSVGISLYVLGRGDDPAREMMAGGWWVLLGTTLALVFALIAPPWRCPPPQR